MLLTNKPVHNEDNFIVIPSLECDESNACINFNKIYIAKNLP
jgi:hypothetical protein